jgi:hypothetical protein
MVERFGSRALDAPVSFEYRGVDYPILSVNKDRLKYRFSDGDEDTLSVVAHKGLFTVTDIILKGSRLVCRAVLFKVEA